MKDFQNAPDSRLWVNSLPIMVLVKVVVDTESAEVRETVQALFALLLDAGAWVNPHLRIVERAGQISVWSEADDPWLMRIPKHTLVPVTDINWSGEPPLRVEGTPSSLSATQQDVLNACVDAMAAHHTWEHFRATHPRATVTDPEAIAMIQSLHPAFSPATDAPAMLKTRTIKMSMDDAEPQSYLMPLLDLVNHHPAAPVYTWDDGFLCIPTWRADPGGECFVSYGSTRDVLGMALAYGYVDENITRANALPGEYSIPGGGTLKLMRASHPTSTNGHAHENAHNQNALTIIGAAWDTSDPGVQRQTLLEPIERHLRDRGMPAMRARHQARVLVRTVRHSNATRLSNSFSIFNDDARSDLVRRAILLQLQCAD